ncbi:MAG: biotin/lipoyl-binding protein, partial [Rhodospirillales bacterium]|nr:biotin/lipoyl-binding protein [Rhodospirillales bacterium]
MWLLRNAPNLLALALAAALCVGIAVRWQRWVGNATDQWTDDATVQSDVTPLAALVAAPVQRVLVNDFQMVKAGQELITLDPRVYAAQLAQAEARVAAAQAALVNLQAQ